MGLHGLETTDGAPELLTFAAGAQCHRRDGTYRAGHQRGTPQGGTFPERLFGDLVRRGCACGYRHTIENHCVTALIGQVGSAADFRDTTVPVFGRAVDRFCTACRRAFRVRRRETARA